MVKILHDLSSGLKAIHDKKIVHLNMTTSNCLIDANMSIKLTNFEISMFVDSDGMKSEARIGGSPGWVSPESS